MNTVYRKLVIWRVKLGDICDFEDLFAYFWFYLRIWRLICVFHSLFANFKTYLHFAKIYQKPTEPPAQIRIKNPKAHSRQVNFGAERIIV